MTLHFEDLDLALPRSSHTFSPCRGLAPPQHQPQQRRAICIPPLAAAAGKWGRGAAKEDTTHARSGTRTSLCSSRSISIGGRGALPGPLLEQPSTVIGGGPTLAVAVVVVVG